MRDRSLQIEHRKAAKSLSRMAARWRWHFVLPWVFAIWLTLPLTEALLRGSDAPGQIAGSERASSPSASPQDTSSSAEESPAVNTSGPHTYGEAEKVGLNYAGTSPPRNVLLLGLNVGSSYDDNIFGDNQHRVGDVDFLFGPSLSLHRDGRLLRLALSYQPNFRIYRKASEPNAVDQTLALDATYQATSRLSFRARGTAYYTTGLFEPAQNGEFVPGLGSLSSLNNTLFTPVARELTWSSRIDTSYQAGAHDSIGLFAGDSRLDFTQQVSSAGNLQNTEERQAGLVYEHRLSPHTTVGSNYLFEDIRFGLDSRTLVHSVFLSYAQQVSRSVTLSVFGGPQYSRLHEVVIFPVDPFRFQVPIFQVGWNWAIGGTLTKRLDKTALELTAQRQVTNGGGFIGAVVGLSVAASVRRQLLGRWDALWSGGYAKNTSVATGFSASEFQTETAGFGLQRSLTERLSFRVEYDFLRQRATGQSPLFASFDRDLWSAQLSYRFHQIGLGR